MLHTNACRCPAIYLSTGFKMSEAEKYSTSNKILASNNSLKNVFAFNGRWFVDALLASPTANHSGRTSKLT